MYNSIALLKLKFKYIYKNESYYASSEFTPVEYDYRYCITEQMNWFKVAVEWLSIDLDILTEYELNQFKESLQISFLIDEKNKSCLN